MVDEEVTRRASMMSAIDRNSRFRCRQRPVRAVPRTVPARSPLRCPRALLEEYVDVLSLGTLHALPDCVVHRIVRRQVVVLKHLLSVLEDPDLVQKHVM